MSETTLSPMLVQYLVGLCCLRRDPESVDVVLGDMVYDSAAKKARDVDVTVAVPGRDGIAFAFKAYEVKREKSPLDVATVEQLALKLRDMQEITHHAVVSASGFTEAARNKAKSHNLELYELQPWTRPLEEQFPVLGMKGTIEECFPLSEFLLCWPQYAFSLVAPDSGGPFTVNSNDSLVGPKGKSHRTFKTFEDYQREILQRSTERLWNIEPAVSAFNTFPVPAFVPGGVRPSGPAWPHSHTLDVSSDAVYVQVANRLCRLDQITITGWLQWQRSIERPLHYILQNTFSGEAFAGALISHGARKGQMTALVFSPRTRDIGIDFVRLADKHLNCIRELTLSKPK